MRLTEVLEVLLFVNVTLRCCTKSINPTSVDSPKFPTPVTFTFLLRYASYAHVPSPLLSSLSSKSVGELRVLNEMYGLGLKIGSGGLVEKGEVVEGVRKGLERREGESEKAREMVRFTLMVGFFW